MLELKPVPEEFGGAAHRETLLGYAYDRPGGRDSGYNVKDDDLTNWYLFIRDRLNRDIVRQ